MADPAAHSQPPGRGPGPSLRIDKFLWFARLAKSRSGAQKLAEQGFIRVNGRRIERSHAAVRPGDLLTLPHGDRARVVRVAALPGRRGPAPEARSCYEEIAVGASPANDSQQSADD